MLVGQDVPSAILMNSEDYGFGVFIIDDKSRDFYEDNLGKISH